MFLTWLPVLKRTLTLKGGQRNLLLATWQDFTCKGGLRSGRFPRANRKRVLKPNVQQGALGSKRRCEIVKVGRLKRSWRERAHNSRPYLEWSEPRGEKKKKITTYFRPVYYKSYTQRR